MYASAGALERSSFWAIMARQVTRSIDWAVPFIVTLMVSLGAGAGASVGVGVASVPPLSPPSSAGASVGAWVGAGVALVRSSTFTDWVGRLPSAPWLMSVSTAPLCPAMSLRPASRSSTPALE